MPVKFLWILYQAWCKADNVTLPKKAILIKNWIVVYLKIGSKIDKNPWIFFKPAIDKPDYFIDGTFNWKEEDKKKTAVLIRKVTQ
ncbi:hypothetical protein [Streptococcus dysgalactiae]|uniref:hypothetical protein n=1 Tax=Streptococcus dysgalactiae TaxID=1334 RepID=UPI0021B13018|nr:hypothetical protein [Streptococcus dysgalactiae]